VKDAIFSGPDVASALEAASRALGQAVSSLRYVVLQEPVPGRLGLTAQPARIAILMDAGRPTAAAGPAPEEAPLPDLPVQIGDLGRRLAEVTGLDLALAVGENDGRFEVKVEGAGAPAFLADEGVQPALEHLLRRWAERAGHDLALAGGGQRERRDEALRQRALQLAEGVRVDGQPRRLEGLNSYERRIVHVALQDAAGVETFSVGEGAGRRVVIAPRVSTVEEE
jgi:predicted RNA-binding protein Jag